MSVARADFPAQEVANVTNWSAEAYCSSKDTVSRMNSPRNSKSSSTPHVSPEAKSHICIGVEVDMEEDCDTSSQSGEGEDGQALLRLGSKMQGETCKGKANIGQRKNGTSSRVKSVKNDFMLDASSNSFPARDGAVDEVNSNLEGQSFRPEATAAGTQAGLSQSSQNQPWQYLQAPWIPVSSAGVHSVAAPLKGRDAKRQKLAWQASAEKQSEAPDGWEKICLQRLQAVEKDPCQLASRSPSSPSENADADLPEELPMNPMADESLSRACSAIPATGKLKIDDAHEAENEAAAETAEAEEEAPPSKRQRSTKQNKRSAAAALRRTSRHSTSGQQSDARHSASADEDYIPPGDPEQDRAPPRRTRLRIRAVNASPSKPDLLPPALLANPPRQTARLRWSASVGQGGQPAGSPPGSRRLRSQPVDLTDLRADAFAFSPPSKRSRQLAIQQGIADLQQLSETSHSPLVRSHTSGVPKPRPEWGGQSNRQLLQLTDACLQELKDRQASDLQLMEPVQASSPPDLLGLGKRLKQCCLGKALTSQRPSKESHTPVEDSLMPSCKLLFPHFMASSLSAWNTKLDSTCVTLFGEPAPARRQRDAHSAWDDILARHSLEADAYEALQSSFIAASPPT